MVKRKKKDTFQEFRSNGKPSYKTIKTPLKSLLHNHYDVQPIINDLILKINDLVINSYQFIRLYILFCFNNHRDLPELDENFILYCIKTLGERSPQGPKSKNINLLNELNEFYNNEYQPLINHEKKQLKNLSYVAQQIETALSNNVQEHFIQHLLRFINKTTDNITKDKKVLYKFKNQ
jgi:hypothetical protein